MKRPGRVGHSVWPVAVPLVRRLCQPKTSINPWQAPKNTPRATAPRTQPDRFATRATATRASSLTLQERKQSYLLRLRQTKNVQRPMTQQFARDDWSRADNQGCQMVEAQLQLLG